MYPNYHPCPNPNPSASSKTRKKRSKRKFIGGMVCTCVCMTLSVIHWTRTSIEKGNDNSGCYIPCLLALTAVSKCLVTRKMCVMSWNLQGEGWEARCSAGPCAFPEPIRKFVLGAITKKLQSGPKNNCAKEIERQKNGGEHLNLRSNNQKRRLTKSCSSKDIIQYFIPKFW